MASNSKKSKTDPDIENNKRPRDSDSDSELLDNFFSKDEIEEVNAQHRQHLEELANAPRKFWPRFFNIIADPSGPPITKLSPFAIEKAIRGLVGTVQSVKKLFRKDAPSMLLVEVSSDAQSKNMMQVNQLANVPVLVREDSRLNQCKGVLRTRELDDMDEDDILEALKPQGIVFVRRMIIKRGDKQITTGTYILTFGTPKLPERVKLGYTVVPVTMFIPNPLRCFKCQRFGHGQLACRGKPTCFRCGGEGHAGTDCSATPKCSNCQGGHMASSKDCPLWKSEKQIVEIKHSKNISFRDARVLFNQINPSKPSGPSYASAASKISKSTDCQTDLTWISSKNPEVYVPKPQPKPQQALPKTKSLGCQTDPTPSPESVSESSSTTSKTQHPAPTSNQSGSISKSNSTDSRKDLSSPPSTTNSSANKTSTVLKTDSKPSKHVDKSKQHSKNPNQNRTTLPKPKKGDNNTVALHNKFENLDPNMEISDDDVQSPNRTHGSSRSSRSGSPRGTAHGGSGGQQKSPVKPP